MAAMLTLIVSMLTPLAGLVQGLPKLLDVVGAVWSNGRAILIAAAVALPAAAGAYYVGKWTGHSEAEKRHAAIVASIRAEDARAQVERERTFEAELAQYKSIEVENDRVVEALPAIKPTKNDRACARSIAPSKWVRGVRKLR